MGEGVDSLSFELLWGWKNFQSVGFNFSISHNYTSKYRDSLYKLLTVTEIVIMRF